MQLTSKGRFELTADMTRLYNLSVGFGRSTDVWERAFLLEPGLSAAPTLCTQLGLKLDTVTRSGLSFAHLVHGEQRLTLHAPLPPAFCYEASERVTAVVDKGEGRGALVYLEKTITPEGAAEPICTLETTVFARADGGCGDGGSVKTKTHSIPGSSPAATIAFDVRPEQAHVHALCGDDNPLHRDPDVARAAGFPKPILQGLCTYGITCRAIMEHVRASPDAVAAFEARFSAPVFPGETIGIDLWRDGDVVSFRARVPERNAVVLDNGRCLLR